MYVSSPVWKGSTRWWIVHGFLRRPVVVVSLAGRTAEALDPGLFGEEKKLYILGQAMYTTVKHRLAVVYVQFM